MWLEAIAAQNHSAKLAARSVAPTTTIFPSLFQGKEGLNGGVTSWSNKQVSNQ